MDAVREFYTQPGVMSSLGSFASSAEALSRDIGGLVDIGQGLLIHEHIAPTYGVTLSEDRRGCVHVRPVERLLERVVAADSRPLFATRPAADRCGGNCRHFTVLLVALLRAQGVPARARCGFGGYFGTGLFEDHWVAEYWNDTQQRWVLVDAQLDLTQRRIFDVDFDPLDVPRDRFLTAGVAWILCRKGSADPSEFGMSVIGESGSWWIAQNLVRDVAALNNMEMLPWDVWGAMPRPPDEPISDERAEFFDRLTGSPIGPTIHSRNCGTRTAMTEYACRRRYGIVCSAATRPSWLSRVVDDMFGGVRRDVAHFRWRYRRYSSRCRSE